MTQARDDAEALAADDATLTQRDRELLRFELEFPADLFGAVVSALTRLGAIPGTPELRGASFVLDGDIPAARVHDLEQQLPGLTRGEGELLSSFDHYRRVHGIPPTRSRTDRDPLDRKQYLLRVAGRI